MDQHLGKLTPVTGGDLRDIVTVSRITALQGAIKELAKRGGGGGRDGSRGRREPNRAGQGGRFIVTHDANNNWLYVRLGYVCCGCATAGEVQRPFEPTLEDTPLSENPYFEVGGKSGTYEVVCVADHSVARMELKKRSVHLELGPCERAWQVAIVKFTGAEVEIEQTWYSDIPWFSEDVSCDSSSGSDDEVSEEDSEAGSDGSDASDASDASDGSEVPDSDDDSDSDSDSDSSSSSSSGAGACPAITDLRATVYSPAYVDDLFVLQQFRVGVTMTLGEYDTHCYGNLSMKVNIAGKNIWKSIPWVVGTGELQMDFDVINDLQLFGCTEYTVTALVEKGVSLRTGCDIEACPPVSATFMTPGLWGNEACDP